MPDPYDVLGVGAHPDDLEVVMGGTVLKLATQGLRVLFVDLCSGEPARHAARGERALELLDHAHETPGLPAGQSPEGAQAAPEGLSGAADEETLAAATGREGPPEARRQAGPPRRRRSGRTAAGRPPGRDGVCGSRGRPPGGRGGPSSLPRRSPFAPPRTTPFPATPPAPSLSRGQVEFKVRAACRREEGVAGCGRQWRPAEIGVKQHAGRVEYRRQRGHPGGQGGHRRFGHFRRGDLPRPGLFLGRGHRCLHPRLSQPLNRGGEPRVSQHRIGARHKPAGVHAGDPTCPPGRGRGCARGGREALCPRFCRAHNARIRRHAGG